MSVAKSLARSSLGLSARALERFRHSDAPRLSIFCFHEVSERPSDFARSYGLSVHPGLFRRQIEWIARTFEVVHPALLAGDQALPANAAVITFDDGFVGAYTHGIDWLRSHGLPSAMFLNMRSIAERYPMISAVALYLDMHNQEFGGFAETAGLHRPFHLAVTPRLLREFEERHGPIDVDAVRDFQGELADAQMVSAHDDPKFVVHGNHLHEHWNAVALSNEELRDQYLYNDRALSGLASYAPLFAFPNGKRGTCWGTREAEVIRRAGARRAFSVDGRINAGRGGFVLDRIALGPEDDSVNRLWYRHNKQGIIDETNAG